jgi:hypothetical protein
MWPRRRRKRRRRRRRRRRKKMPNTANSAHMISQGNHPLWKTQLVGLAERHTPWWKIPPQLMFSCRIFIHNPDHQIPENFKISQLPNEILLGHTHTSNPSLVFNS